MAAPPGRLSGSLRNAADLAARREADATNNPHPALCLATGVAAAQPRKLDHVQAGGDLAAVCEPATSGVARLAAIAYCPGFLNSAGQYHALMYPPGGPMQPLFCVSNPGHSIAETGIAFARWLRDNPGYAQEPTLDGMLRWAQSSFPCRTTSRRRRTR